jgi:soluble lytic murein transglycosylase-like protein
MRRAAWHPGCSFASVVPSVLHFRGAPVPGLPAAVAGRPHPRAVDFQALLRRSIARPAEAPGPAGALAGLRPPARIARPAPPARPAALRPAAPPAPPPPPASPPAAPSRPRAAALTPAKQALVAAIRTAAAHAGVEPALSVAVARAESSLDPRARSADGLSVGTFQVTFATAAEMRRKIARGTVARPPGTDDVALGVGYLRYLHDLFGRRAVLARGLETVPVADAAERRLFAVAAFNAGEGRVARAQAMVAARGGDPTRFAEVRPLLPRITQGYVERVVGYTGEERAAAVAV